MALSVTALIVALPVEESATVPPLALRRLPLASASLTVTLEVVEPLATTLVGDATSVVFELVGSAAPAVKVIVAVSVMAAPSSVPEIVTLSATVFVTVAV